MAVLSMAARARRNVAGIIAPSHRHVSNCRNSLCRKYLSGQKGIRRTSFDLFVLAGHCALQKERVPGAMESPRTKFICRQTVNRCSRNTQLLQEKKYEIEPEEAVDRVCDNSGPVRRLRRRPAENAGSEVADQDNCTSQPTGQEVAAAEREAWFLGIDPNLDYERPNAHSRRNAGQIDARTARPIRREDQSQFLREDAH